MADRNTQIVVMQVEELRELIADTVRGLLPFAPAPPAPNEEEFLTRQQTATLLKISLATVNEWSRNGKLNRYRNGNARRVLFKRSEVMACMKETPTLNHLKKVLK